jgi:hypothetical protein
LLLFHSNTTSLHRHLPRFHIPRLPRFFPRHQCPATQSATRPDGALRVKNEDADENRTATKIQSADGAENPAANTRPTNTMVGGERDIVQLIRQVICYRDHDDRATRQNKAQARASHGAIPRQMAVAAEVADRHS